MHCGFRLEKRRDHFIRFSAIINKNSRINGLVSTFSLRTVSGTGLVKREFREALGLDQFQVFLHSALHGSVDLDPGRLKLLKCSAADAAYNHSVHVLSAQGGQGLALTVLVMHVLIDYSLHPRVPGFDHDEEPSRTEMAVYQALSTLVILSGEGDLHEYIFFGQMVYRRFLKSVT